MKGKKEEKFEQRGRSEWERRVGTEREREGRKITGQHEGEDWQRGRRAPHLACALGPVRWGSGPVSMNDKIGFKNKNLQANFKNKT